MGVNHAVGCSLTMPIHPVIGQRQFIVFPRHGHVLHSAELTRLLTERRE